MIKTSFKIAMVFILFGVLLMFLFVGHEAYVFGGRSACDNSDMFLNQDFQCEEKPTGNKEEINLNTFLYDE